MVVLCPDRHWERQKGQVLLIVVLVMIVALTVGLSLISRSVTNLRTSTEEAESQKALAAAEAGIEQALVSDTQNPQTANSLDSFKSSYKTSITQVTGASFFLNGENAVAKDDGADVWLSLYKEDDTIFDTPLLGSHTVTVYWGDTKNSCDATAPALEIAVISGPEATPSLQRYAFDPCDTRNDFNKFAAASPVSGQVDIAGKNYTFKWSANIPITNGLIMRIVPVYYDARIAVKSSTALPLQGKLITATGTSGETQRRVNVFQGHPKIPTELFPYSIFSP